MLAFVLKDDFLPKSVVNIVITADGVDHSLYRVEI